MRTFRPVLKRVLVGLFTYMKDLFLGDNMPEFLTDYAVSQQLKVRIKVGRLF